MLESISRCPAKFNRAAKTNLGSLPYNKNCMSCIDIYGLTNETLVSLTMDLVFVFVGHPLKICLVVQRAVLRVMIHSLYTEFHN
jgi:hypothetical protein